MLLETAKLKMDMLALLKKTLHGDLKPRKQPPSQPPPFSAESASELTPRPVVTQCTIRHLYARTSEPEMAPIIAKAKDFERRYCGHHPETHPEPLPTHECLLSVVDGKDTGKNKHRYVVATQDHNLRKRLREIPGVPLIYVNRGVMIMEPMAGSTEAALAREERGKFRAEIRSAPKRKRPEEEAEEEGAAEKKGEGEGGKKEGGDAPAKKKKNYGKAKGPNPLAMKKKKKPGEQQKQ